MVRSADTIRAQVNVFHLTRGRIYGCISTYIAKNNSSTYCKIRQGPYMALRLQIEFLNIPASCLKNRSLSQTMTALFGVRRILELEQTFFYLGMHD
jgi:hypothetical protein